MTGRLFRSVIRFLSDPRGGVSAMLALMLIPMIGVFGMGAEASSWYLIQRAAQNAADSSAMAAASNGCAAADPCHTSDLSATYAEEATSVAKKLGFQNDTATTVAAANVVCPGGTTLTCYRVTITRKVPVSLLRVVGYNGDTTLSGAPAQTVVASATASRKGTGKGYCMTALGSGSNAIDVNGAPNLGSGCSMLVPNGGASCTNQAGLAIKYADVKTPAPANKKCGNPATGGERTTGYSDPTALLNSYDALKSNLPDAATACPGGYGGSTISGPLTFAIASPKCGKVTLTGDVTVTADSVLLIENGDLDLKTYTLKTASGVHLVIIFSGTTSGSYSHTVTGGSGGALNIYAPTSGPWEEMAIYQDPRLTSGVDLTYHGSNPDFNVSGIVYAPNAKIDIAGEIGPSQYGDACLSFIAKTITISGTANIFAEPTRDCTRAATLAGTEVRQAMVQ
jgi:Flp pilus assembly protein TadG